MFVMNKKTIWTIVVVVIVVGAALAILYLPKKEEPVVGPEVPEVREEIPEVPEGTPEAPEPELKEISSEGEEIAPGASKVTPKGEVVTGEGEKVETAEIIPGSEKAPQQSKVLEEEEKIEVAKRALEMEVSSEKGFVPSAFRVKPGQVVTIMLSSAEGENHTLRFKDPSLRAVAISLSGGETKAVSFNAPDIPGEYQYFCPHPGHESETGIMFVAD